MNSGHRNSHVPATPLGLKKSEDNIPFLSTVQAEASLGRRPCKLMLSLLKIFPHFPQRPGTRASEWLAWRSADCFQKKELQPGQRHLQNQARPLAMDLEGAAPGAGEGSEIKPQMPKISQISKHSHTRQAKNAKKLKHPLFSISLAFSCSLSLCLGIGKYIYPFISPIDGPFLRCVFCIFPHGIKL